MSGSKRKMMMMGDEVDGEGLTRGGGTLGRLCSGGGEGATAVGIAKTRGWVWVRLSVRKGRGM